MSGKDSGWVKLWRDQFHHEISERKPWCDGYAWTYIYSRANYKHGIVNFRNQYIQVDRGQFIISALKLSELFGWSRRRVNSFLTSLEVRGMCYISRSNRFIIITICNYDKYQSTEIEIDTTDVAPDVTTDAQQVHTNKKLKKEKKKRTPEEILSEISVMRDRYQDQETINQVFQAIASIRKTNQITDSVKLSILQAWNQYPIESVMTGIRAYLEKGYAGQGKNEKYLLGIIRNLKPEESERDGHTMKSTGSRALDDYYRDKGINII